ncbi:tetratricopeptide repeat protein [Chryseolinea lacunae]|uniref:Tetratricopeptide repeat protein n=1 Tax=Chryseolinea lacunae TaxID=2801331 RepID=A0ABS1KPS6_9BACT|nr:tetratricopeptide repeat protein [Chryseolinea lacunae]MBL0741436.1 tetratricopeptide repeat protein [Chryseolinea lacunae]
MSLRITSLTLLLTVVLSTTAGKMALAQQTIFGLFRNDVSLGDKYYKEKNFQGALKLYLSAARKDSDIQLRVARCYYALKEYDKAVYYYNNYLKVKRSLPWSDTFFYAEVQAASGNYKTAIDYYQKHLINKPDDELVIRKVWRLSNIQYLYEDSIHYAVRPISVNTEYGELCAVYFKNEIVFMSNRKEPELVETVNAAINAPFYKIYSSRVLAGQSANGGHQYSKASQFSKEFVSRFNAGPVIFYDHDQKMAFVSTAHEAGNGGKRSLQLYFAEWKEGEWKVTEPFPYNSRYHSISDPAISDDGKLLFFSSDMGGGFGGRDLYRSTLEDGKWTQPVNLGETVNTPYDESFPFLHQNRTLYFSSNGHAGLGGLDIFQSAIKTDGYSEPQNAGYPINTSFDDFGMVVDSLDMHGYFSSNRKSGGYNDDIYEFDMDLQSYPVTIEGVVKIKEHAWSDSSSVTAMPHVRIYLVDNLRNTVVHQSVANSKGAFSLVVPYYSEYVIRVVDDNNKENVVVLEIPKHQKQLGTHEIVFVKDTF